MMIGEVRTTAIFVSLSICVLGCDSSSLPGGSRPAIVSRSRFLAYRRLRNSGTLPALEADRQVGSEQVALIASLADTIRLSRPENPKEGGVTPGV